MAMAGPENQWLLTREVLARVRLSRKTLERLRQQGKFPLPFPINDRGDLAYLASEVEAWVKKRESDRARR